MAGAGEGREAVGDAIALAEPAPAALAEREGESERYLLLLHLRLSELGLRGQMARHLRLNEKISANSRNESWYL